MKSVSIVIAATLWAATAAALTPTSTLSPRPSATPTPEAATKTPTSTPTPTATACGADPPIVDPVRSPEIFLNQVIVVGGRVTGARFIEFSSPAGCTMPTPRGGTTFEADCRLLPNQINEISVCIVNPLCGPSACTRTDRNGNPLDILSIDVTPTASPTPLCQGDCDGDGMVTIDEILSLVPVTLQILPLDHCDAADPDGDGGITIDDIIRAVSNALNGCG